MNRYKILPILGKFDDGTKTVDVITINSMLKCLYNDGLLMMVDIPAKFKFR